ncbi:MAG: BCD family MFS transporter [Anaerolineae bacterium]|jgi:BCD family chlorophyll transporter-like MFS transporter|nr:BCD family MFS transporter [Anaerolineae bacterium]
MPKNLTRLLVWLTRLGDQAARPLQAWFTAHPDVGWWLRVLRLGLIQFGIGLSLAPISGALNRVLITDLKIPAVAVGFLIALHYFVSPVRAMIGYRSDKARSDGKWRTPYVVLGVMLTFAGLTCAPFALILLGGHGSISFLPAMVICSVIFIAYGAGINILETVYLALVSDITPAHSRGKVISVLWIMLVLGTVISAIVVGAILTTYSHQRLIQVMQASAIIFVLLTVAALWGQERLRPDGSIISELKMVRVRLTLWESIRKLGDQRALQALFGLIFLATMAFATHDVLLEPYGGQVLNMSVSATMQLTALWGLMNIVGVGAAGFLLYRKQPIAFLIGLGCVLGLFGFGILSYSSQSLSVPLFQFGVACISIGRGLFIVGSVILVMSLVDVNHAGLFLGLWGIVQAMAQGIGVIGSGLLRDVAQFATGQVTTGYNVVYLTSFGLLALVVAILVLHLGQHLRVDEIRMPWAGAEEIPADQLIF